MVQKLVDADLIELLRSIPMESRERFGDFTTHVIAPGGREGKERLYRMQPAIQSLADREVIATAEHDIRKRLAHQLRMNDDEHWATTMWRKHRVSVQIHPTASGKWLLISPSISVLDDPVVVQVVFGWLSYVGEDNRRGAQVRLASLDGHSREGTGKPV